jgi:hypothetical protein
MKHLSTQMKQQQIEWRRAKVLELSSQGYSEREIAEKLQPLAPVTVHRDLVYLNKQAKESLKIHLQDTIPEEYQRRRTAYNQISKQAWEIVNKPGIDDKTKLQALALISECEKNTMDLVTNGVYVTNAFNSIQAKLNLLNTFEKQQNIPTTEEGQTTTNGVF